MPKQFIQKRPVTSVALLVTVCLSLGMVVTQVQATIDSSVVAETNNPHLIPDDLNPKLHWLEHTTISAEILGQVDLIARVDNASENISEEADTIHAIAMKNNKRLPEPTYDYTTGTAN